MRRAWDAVVCARASLGPRPSRIRHLQYVASRRLQYVAKKPENEATYIEHANLGLYGGCGGMLPQENFEI